MTIGGESGRTRATMVLGEYPMSLRGSGDYEAVDVSVRSKIEYLNQGYSFLINQVAETKHSVREVQKQLESVATMLGNQSTRSDRKEFTQSQYPGTSNLQYQVPIANLEQNQGDSQLGYRSGDVLSVVDNHDSILQDSVMPMFEGTHPKVWISRMEKFFSFMNCAVADKMTLVSFCLEGDALRWFRREMHRLSLLNWTEFTCRLLAKFGQTEGVMKTESFPAIAQQAEVILRKDLVAAIDQGLHLRREIETIDCVENSDLFLEHETFKTINEEHASMNLIYSPVQNSVEIQQLTSSQNSHLSDEAILKTDVVLETSMVKQANSTLTAETVEKFGDHESSLRHTCCVSGLDSFVEVNKTTTEEVNVIAAEEREKIPQYWSDILKPAIMDDTYEHSGDKTEEILPLSQLGVGFAKRQGAHSLLKPKTCDRCKQGKKKMRLASKSWMFKFKRQMHYEALSCADYKMMDGKVSGPKTEVCRQGNFSCEEAVLEQFLNDDMLIMLWGQKKPREEVVYHSRLKETRTHTLNESILEQKRMCGKSWSFKYKYERVVLELESGRTTKLSAVEVAEKRRTSFPLEMGDKLQQLTIVFAGNSSEVYVYDNSKVWHKLLEHQGIVWLWFNSKEPKDQSPFSFFTSLRASLCLREGVYKRYLTCLLIVDVLLWLLSPVWKAGILVKHLRNQREETELIAQCLLQAFQQLTHTQPDKGNLLFQEKVYTVMDHQWSTKIEILLMHIRTTLLQAQLQRIEKMRKSWMFKYKRDTRRIQMLNLAKRRLYWCCIRREESRMSAVWISCVLIHHICNNSFFPSKLVGKLVVVGGSIDRHRLSSLTWQADVEEIMELRSEV